MPRKRGRQKIITKESQALKRMRLARGLSLKKAYRKSGIHDTIINHAENGWATITEDYINKFINGMGFTMKDWDDFLNGRVTTFDLRYECMDIVKNMNGDKLKAVHSLLINFSN